MSEPPDVTSTPSSVPPLAITLGEPAGIGPEVTVAALCSEPVLATGSRFVLFGPPERFDEAARALLSAGRDVEPYRRGVERGTIAFQPVPLSGRSRPGTPCAEDEPAVVASILDATRAALRGEVAGLVTAPIDKRALFHQGYPGWGHTELIAHATGAATPTMVLMSRPGPHARLLRVALVTNHVPLAQVVARLDRALLESRARVVHDGLRRLGIERPRLAVAGLNPHAGEKGELGTEEIDLLAPAVEALRAEGLDVAGPLSSDTVFVRAIAGDFDAVLALYHDQGMIPVKVYGFGHGVNWTLGIPIVRTSPDHGTAYDIAGTGRADATSMIEAVLLALALSRSPESRVASRES